MPLVDTGRNKYRYMFASQLCEACKQPAGNERQLREDPLDVRQAFNAMKAERLSNRTCGQMSALHVASAHGLTRLLTKLLSLGANAALTDEVKEVCVLLEV